MSNPRRASSARPALLGMVALLGVGCVYAPTEDDDDDWGEADTLSLVQGVAVAGRWTMPASVRAIAARQRVGYNGAPPWSGGRNCGGSFLAGTRELGDYLRRSFRQVRSYGGYSCRPNTANTSQTSVHGTGRAIDVFIPTTGGQADNTEGDPVAHWLVTHAQEIGVQLVIWDRSIWGPSTSPDARPYGGPHPHHDHLHVELTIEGANRRTPWFGARVVDTDRDGVPDSRDNCRTTDNRDQRDTDRDGIGNACDNCDAARNRDQRDRDRDGVGDSCDNCASISNRDQQDLDRDGVGGTCDNCSAEANRDQRDGDRDGRGDACDNCPGASNRGQADQDDDERGDVCDDDRDGDGVNNGADNCALRENRDQADRDRDGRGDVCDADDDGDTVADAADNCRGVPNRSQEDQDRDGRGDACDDSDGDGALDAVDNCARLANADQADLDADQVGDVCDVDRDNDGAPDAMDNCAGGANADQRDTDGDGLGDACDDDRDGDGTPDAMDNCDELAGGDQRDTDGDGEGDACDLDGDGDGLSNADDNCPFDVNVDQLDTDGDGFGDVCDRAMPTPSTDGGVPAGDGGAGGAGDPPEGEVPAAEDDGPEEEESAGPGGLTEVDPGTGCRAAPGRSSGSAGTAVALLGLVLGLRSGRRRRRGWKATPTAAADEGTGRDSEPGMRVFRRAGLACVLGVALALASRNASAGDCPECQSASDCPREGSFCVRHDSTVGCGARVQLCCPGQGCGLATNGRPTCEQARTCTVVTVPTDAGTPATDSGAPTTDSGASSDVPVGEPPPAGSSASCSARVGGTPTGFGRIGLAALALVALRRRRHVGR